MEQENSELRENVMAFIVMYERTDGTLAAESCEDLDAAVMAAERLRNSESVDRPRIYETTEIEYDFKPYFRVQLAGADAAGSAGVVGSADAPVQAVETESNKVDWPAFESTSTDVADDTDTDIDSTATAEVSPVEAVEADLASIEASEAELDGSAAEDDTYVSDLDVLNVEDEADIDLTDGAVDGDVADVADGGQKSGLFDKFVKTLEGEEGDAAAVDDLTSADTPRRGLFGR